MEKFLGAMQHKKNTTQQNLPQSVLHAKVRHAEHSFTHTDCFLFNRIEGWMSHESKEFEFIPKHHMMELLVLSRLIKLLSQNDSCVIIYSYIIVVSVIPLNKGICEVWGKWRNVIDQRYHIHTSVLEWRHDAAACGDEIHKCSLISVRRSLDLDIDVISKILPATH